MKIKFAHAIAILALLITLDLKLSYLHAQGTAFTYQGRLIDTGSPANGEYDLRFALYDDSAGGAQQGPILTNSSTTVGNGLFTVTLNFGANFPGAARWLEIGVRTNGDGGFTTLTPRQPLTPSPYAITAENIAPGAGLAGTYGGAVTFNNSANQFTGSFTGNGGGLTNVNSATLGGLASSNFWQLGGNTVSAGQFLGSANNQVVEVRANNLKVMQFAYASNAVSGYSPNVIGGNSANSVAAGVVGGTVGGGGGRGTNGVSSPNLVNADFGTVSGGSSNTISSSGAYAFIGGGWQNTASQGLATIGGGLQNTANNAYATVGGGFRNTASGPGAIVGGGALNVSSGVYSTVVGGTGNTASGGYAIAGGTGSTASGPDSVAFGTGSQASGTGSTAMGFSVATSLYSTAMGLSDATGPYATAMGDLSDASGYASAAMGASGAGGDYSTAMGQSTASGTNSIALGYSSATNSYATAMGYSHANGFGSTALGLATANGAGATAMGGGFADGDYSTSAGLGSAYGFDSFAEGTLTSALGDESFAGGNRAGANHANTFVWNDDSAGYFPSTSSNQFLIHADGGVGIGLNSPSAALHVASSSSSPQFQITQNNSSDYTRLRMNVSGFPSWEMDVSSGATPSLSWWTGTLRMTLDYNGNLTTSGTVNGTSDRNAKEKFTAVSSRAVLDKVAALPISEWNFKNESSIRHIGPMAQDFYAAFSVGMDDKHIATVDEEGVALAAIQGLNQKVEEKNAEIQNLKQQNEMLGKKLDELMAMVKLLARKE